MSDNSKQDTNSGYGNPPYRIPPSEYYCPPGVPYDGPIQGPYVAPAYQQPGYGVPPVTHRPLKDAIRELPRQYVKVITKPSAATFAEEINKASWGMLWVQLLGITLFALVISLLLIPLYPLLLQHTLEAILGPLGPNSLPPSAFQQMQASIQQQMQTSLQRSIVTSIASVPVYFFLGQGLYFFLAKAFHGTGQFLTQCYTTLLFHVPLSIIGNILGILALFIGLQIPGLVGLFIGLPFSLAIGIYTIVLQIFSLMAVHRLSGGKSSAVVLIPYAVFLVLYLILIFLLVFIVIFILSALRPH